MEKQLKRPMSQFNQMQKSFEPLGGPAKQCSLIPIHVACALALNGGSCEILASLGDNVPDSWVRAERWRANEVNGEVCRGMLPCL